MCSILSHEMVEHTHTDGSYGNQIFTLKTHLSVNFSHIHDFYNIHSSGAPSFPTFGKSVNPIPTRGADFALLITTVPSGFWTISLLCSDNNFYTAVHIQISVSIY